MVQMRAERAEGVLADLRRQVLLLNMFRMR